MTNWLNNDGLYVKFGASQAAVENAGEYRTAGPLHWTEVTVDLTKLGTSAEIILADVTEIEKNARIEEVEVEVVTGATSGGSATLDVGLIQTDRTTDIDANGLVAAAALADIDTAGNRLTLITGATYAGALIGTVVANPGLFVAKAGTAVFTAGVLKVRVKYSF